MRWFTRNRDLHWIIGAILFLLSASTSYAADKPHTPPKTVVWDYSNATTATWRLSDDEVLRWKRYFPALSNFPRLMTEPEELLLVDQPQCLPSLAALNAGLNAYARSAALSLPQADVEGRWAAIVSSIENAEKLKCGRIALKLYALKSVIFQERAYFFSRMSYFPQRVSDLRASDPPGGEVGLYTILATAALLNKDRIEFYPWLKSCQLSPARQRVFGAYECARGLIFVDPSLRPFDFGASITHELMHAFLDKFTTADSLSADFPDGDKVNWKAYLLEDELLAIVVPAAEQKGLTSFPYQKRKLLGRFQAERWPFNIQGDLQMFAAGGPLETLWGSRPYHMEFPEFNFVTDSLLASKDKILAWGAQVQQDFNSFGEHAIEGLTIYQPTPLEIKQGGSFLDAVLPQVARTYFSGWTLDAATREELRPDRLGVELVPLLANARKTGHYLLQVKGATSVFLNDLDRVLDLNPSPTCGLFKGALDDGELSDYLGKQVAACSQATDPVLPSGGDGTRPGGDGTRPGGDGTRPGGDGVRPCLSIVSGP